MKLARATLSVICSNDFSWNSREQHRPSVSRKSWTFEIRRPQAKPTARWRLSPQTQRLECVWAVEAGGSERPLCRRLGQRRRGSISARHSVSQIRNGVL